MIVMICNMVMSVKVLVLYEIHTHNENNFYNNTCLRWFEMNTAYVSDSCSGWCIRTWLHKCHTFSSLQWLKKKSNN